MANRGLILTFIAGAAIASHRILKPGADDNHFIQATGGTDKLMGVSDLGAASAEDRVDVIMDKSCEVEYGGVVAIGDFLTSDADGKAVVVAAGFNTIGKALVSGVSGDIGEVLLSAGKI